MMNLLKLNDQTLVQIILKLDLTDLRTARYTNKKLYLLIDKKLYMRKANEQWRGMYVRRWRWYLLITKERKRYLELLCLSKSIYYYYNSYNIHV